jgi:2-phosphoglycerate kinase
MTLQASTQARDRLKHVYWIGGGSGGGKSTIAARIAERYGLTLYATDDVIGDHARRSTSESAPYLQQFARMDMDERWLNRSPEVMLATFHWYRGEGFEFIVEDLLAMSADRGVVAEGFRLLPELVAPLLADDRHAVWLIPTPEFRRAALQSRGGPWRIAGRTSDPERALANLLERDRLFTEGPERSVAALGLPAVQVDTAMTEDDLGVAVAKAFGL